MIVRHLMKFLDKFRVRITVLKESDALALKYYGKDYLVEWNDVIEPKLISSDEHGLPVMHFVEFSFGENILSFGDQHKGFYDLVEWLREKSGTTNDKISSILSSRQACLYFKN